MLSELYFFDYPVVSVSKDKLKIDKDGNRRQI